MKQSFSERNPVIASIIWAVIILVFYAIGGAVTTITGVQDASYLFLFGVFVLLSVIPAFIYMCRSRLSLQQYGFQKPYRKIQMAYYIPAIFIEALGFLAGFRELNPAYILSAFFFTLSVGIAEEFYFRGIMITLLSRMGTKKAILISSVIFGLTHIGNVAGGAKLSLTIVQIVFAFVFGIVFAELFVLTKSLVPVILWHFIHDFLGYIQTPSAELSNSQLLFFTGIQTLILILYAFFLWKKLEQSKDN
ncbi:CAAX amino protease [Anaerocolumna cellulosilytica]|uniref:CAAX amino protease n=1 Tax=Anaerocolumna cellulosilytica TaxID=433286 RepID=A0A6S6R0N8_9FIRM|nr:CPBP family intramembrane glutamic endopeptidase [Anaerocolumna cellulosilytica]MBB5197665.1 hypothetical protein [Anaerocolumna cellulosilytica]BCJ93112.1 CAAX amino protease [Anaerocolumna cellulosilytica]